MPFTDRFFGEFQSGRNRRLLLGILAIGLITRLWISWQPIEVLITKNLPDDAYFYFSLAQNVNEHRSLSIDGMSVSNGFHPLWFLTIAPLFSITQAASNLPIHFALSLASFIDALSIVLLARLAVNVLKDKDWALVAAWMYAMNPIVVLQSTNGLETSLGIFTLLLFLHSLRIWLTGDQTSHQSLQMGIFAGLMFLARSDSIFLFAFAMAAAFYYERSWKIFSRLSMTGLAALLTVSPWLYWSYREIGTVIQESGVAVPYILRSNLASEVGNNWQIFLTESLEQIFSRTVWLRGDISGLPFFIGPFVWLLVFVLLSVRWIKSSNRLEKSLLLPLFLSCISLVLAHTGFRWFPRAWYFIPCSVAFAIGFALIGKLRLNKPIIKFTTFLLMSTFFVISGYLFWTLGYYPWQKEVLAANEWLSKNISKEERVGSFFFSGIYSYYNDFRVVNLDGVMNHDAFEAIQQEELLPYMQRKEIDYLLDSDLAVWSQYDLFMGEGFPEDLEEIAILGDELSEELGFLRLYKINR